jgi:hypothetical protein
VDVRTYFVGGQFYEQTDGVAMGSPLYPVIANFEERALKQAIHKPLCWFRYVDDTFVIWPQGTEKLERFLDHLNGLHRKIQFAVVMEKNGHLPFLDLNIYRRTDVSLGRKVYRKSTHTNLYLNPGSHHHPSNKQAVLATLVFCVTRRASMVSCSSLRPLSNRYSRQLIQRALNPKVRTSKPTDQPTSVALLPYIRPPQQNACQAH